MIASGGITDIDDISASLRGGGFRYYGSDHRAERLRGNADFAQGQKLADRLFAG